SVLLVQKPNSLGVKTVCESGSPCSDAPVASTRRQQCENSIAWVAVVLNDVPCFSQASCVVDAVHGMEMAADDTLRCLHHPLQGLAIGSGAATIPDSDAACEDALNGASIKVGEDSWAV